MKKLLALVFGLCLTISAFAQENSLLWKISGNGLKKDSYLFGTLHMACAEDFKIMDKVVKAAEQAEAIAFEINVAKPETMQSIQGLIQPDPEFFKGFDPMKKKAIDSALLSRSIPPAIFDQVSPAMVISFLSMQSFACSDPQAIKSMEIELGKLPAVQGKEVAELETAEFQFTLLNSLFKAEDFYKYLISDENPEEVTRKLVNAYFTENMPELEKLLSASDFLSPENHAKFLDDRNKAWLAKMPEMMKSKSFLFAVGAGHLVGKNGVIELLRKNGYKVTAVLN